MADRSEQVSIYLRAINAAKTRRDIKSVADEIDRLDDETRDYTKSSEQNTSVVEENSKAHKKRSAAVAEAREATEKATKSQKNYTTALFDEKDALKQLAKNTTAAKRLYRQRDAAYEKSAQEIIKSQKASKRTQETFDDWVKRRTIMQANRLEILKKQHLNRLAVLDEIDRRRELRNLDKHHKKILTKRQKFLRAMQKVRFPRIERPGRVLLYSSIIFGVMDVLPVIGTALNSVLAGAIALVNGLAPIAGLFGTLPSLILSMTQFGIVGKMAAKAVAKEFAGLKEYAKVISDDVGKSFLNMARDGISAVAQKYFPILRRELTATGAILGMAVNEFAYWLKSAEGVNLITRILRDNNKIIGNTSSAAGYLAQAFLYIAKAAGPTVVIISRDILGAAIKISELARDKNSGIAAFFDKGYKSAKRGGKIIGNFLTGFYYIFKGSAPLTKSLSDDFLAISKHFKSWAKSHPQDILKYFIEMRGDLRALGKFAWQFVTAIFRISRSKNFQGLMREMGDKLVPALERLIMSLDGRFVNLVVQFVEHLAQLADSGVVDVLIDVGQALTDIIGGFANWYSSLGDFTKKAVVWGLVITGLFGGIATTIIRSIAGIITAIGKMIGALKKGRGAAAGAAAGGGGAGGTSGGVAGGGGKGSKGATVAGGARRAAEGKPKKSKATPRRAIAREPRAGGLAEGGVGAAAGMLALPVIGAFIGDTSNQLSDMNAELTTTQGNLDRFFQKANGESLAPATVQFDNTLGAVDDLGSALERITKADWGTKFGDGISSGLYTLVGATSPIDQVKNSFHQLDGQLANLPAKQAASKFSEIAAKAKALGIPTEDLVSLFPQYADKVRNTLGPMSSAKGGADRLASAMGSISYAISSINTSKLDEVNRKANEALGLTGNLKLSVYAKGGEAPAGRLALAGEAGSELGMDRSGRVGLFSGPTLFRPSNDIAVIPHSATVDPIHGDYQNAPDWARMALQRAVNINSDKPTALIPKNRRGPSETSHYDFNFTGASFGGGTDLQTVKDAVINALKEAERDRKERR